MLRQRVFNAGSMTLMKEKALFLFFLAGVWALPARGADSVAEAISAEVRKIFEERKAAVVKVRARDRFGIRVGSGFFIGPAGTIYTHAGIVLKSDEVSVVHDGRELPAQVLVADERSGIALLKVEASTPFILLGDSREVQVATPVMLIGFPEDLEASPSFGIITGFDKQYLGRYFSTTHFRANMPVQPGQAGSPVLNLQGKAIGIVMARVEGSACHILPIRAAEKVRLDFVRFGELKPGWVGVQVKDIKDQVNGSKARVVALDPSTPAAESGLQTGDILLKVGDTPIATSEDVLDASYFLTAGYATRIDALRNGKKISVTVLPTLHPLAPVPEMQAVAPDAIQKIRLE